MNYIYLSFTLLLSSCLLINTSQSQSYGELKASIEQERLKIQTAYLNAGTQERSDLIDDARNYLVETMSDELFKHWYGTPWDFNGMSRTPRQGSIACGYFVTNTLTDAGFNIPRIRWAQSASEVFIKELSPNHIKRFSNRPIEEIENYLLNSGNGLYVVGLDNHTGFILVDDNRIRFIHSNYYWSEVGVMSEAYDSENPLKHSNYRVIGKLFSDEMVKRWILGEAYY